MLLQNTKNAVLIRGLTAFFAGLALAVVLGWSLPDLIWSLWLSSLIVGFTYIVWSIFYTTADIKVPYLRLVSVMAGVVFFMIHFGMFHFIHSVFLYEFVPIGEPLSDNLPVPDYLFIFKKYCWILPIAFFANIELFKNPQKGATAAYGNVIKIHLLIFIFAGMTAVKLNSFFLYLAAYSFFFFPLSLFFTGKKKQDSLPKTTKG